MKFQGKIFVNGGGMIANIDNKSYHVTPDHEMYRKLFQAFKDNDADSFLKWMNEKQSLETYVQEEVADGVGITVSGERVFYNGVELENSIVDTIRNMMRNGLDFKPMLKFLERAIDSGSSRVVNELFSFLQVCGCTITEDGCFLAYKTVRSDYYDKYSGKILNQIGVHIPRLERWQVDDNCNNACSHGYHVGALAYAGPGGWYNSSSDKVMICKVAPEDVISVPTDHSCQKLRCCWYEVVGEYQGQLESNVYHGNVGGDYSQGIQARPIRERIKPEDMLVDGVYTATYTNKAGECRQRYFVVHEFNTPGFLGKDHVVVELMEPEDNVGDIRRFNLSSLSDVYEWDGEEILEDEEEDLCPNCEDCDCDGYCDEPDEEEDYGYGKGNYRSYW